MNTPQSDWRYRLKGDPTRWLLDEADNPSVFFWFLRDIVGRPEDSPSLIQAREKILYSDPVQAIFALQDPLGYWESPNSLDLPRYSATLWMLALLAELGIPRTSRRATLASEFILQNHVNSDGAFTGLRDAAASGLLARTLLYFRSGDSRLDVILDRLEQSASDGDVYALWALAESGGERFSQSIRQGREKLISAVADGALPFFGTWPPFEQKDLLLALRVLRSAGAGQDTRLAGPTEYVWQKQQDGACWNLETNFEGMLPIQVETTRAPSKWATLNALRVITDPPNSLLTR